MKRYFFTLLLALLTALAGAADGIQPDSIDFAGVNSRYSRYSAEMPLQERRMIGNDAYRAGVEAFRTDDFYGSMQYLLKALDISEDTRDTLLMANTLKDIGNIYSVYDDFEQSITLYTRALTAAESIGNDDLTERLLTNLIVACCYHDRTDTARAYFNRLQSLSNPSPQALFDIEICRGMLAQLGDDMAEAERSYLSAAQLADRQLADKSKSGSAYSHLVGVYLATGRLDDALRYIRLGQQIAHDSGQERLAMTSLLQKAMVLDAQGRSEEALEARVGYYEMYDSVLSRSKFNALQNARMLYDTHRNNLVIDSLESSRATQEQKARERGRALLVALIALTVLAVMLAVILRQKRRLHGAYMELFERSRPQPEAVQETSEEPADDPRSRELYDRIRRIMATDAIFNPDFSLASLAEMAGSNTAYVSEAVNRFSGSSFRTLLSDYRLREAKRRLADHDRYGRLTIKAIGESVGYRSQSTFITLFTRATGLKPSTWRDMARESRSDF